MSSAERRCARSRVFRFAGSHIIAFHRSLESMAVISEGGCWKSETYQAAACLRVAAAGVTVAVAPLAGAQVKAGAGAREAVVALLQSARQEKKKRKKKKSTSGEEQVTTKREYVFVPLQHGNRHTAIIIKDCSGGRREKFQTALLLRTSTGTFLPASLLKNLKLNSAHQEMESSS